MKNILLILLWLPLLAKAQGIDRVRQALEQSSVRQVQEKVYIHTDNECYFVGDTLWYKAYVVRADNLQPTDMSRILYVELLSPDGLLVERQNIIVSSRGLTCGQFVLRDSLYSGYYELRAYTRWMLNFNVDHRRYRREDAWWFYNRQMAADYFRTWEGLYSRVLPVYSKPDAPGDYDARRIYQRPKQRIAKPKKDNLTVTFYPEGGHFIEGVENRVAFEAVDQLGEAQQIAGTIHADGQQPLAIKTEHMGRGSFCVTPGRQRLEARFTFRGKQYSFTLPKAEQQGVALQMDGQSVRLQARGLPQDKEYALAVLCRGALRHFEALPTMNDELSTMNWRLPSGVCDLCIFDSDGRILASRLFFVNHGEQADALITADIQPTHTYAPYERIEVPVRLQGVSARTVFSLSIRDTRTDEPTYNDGNLMTDLLLASDLRGFIARPAHYFEADDAEHRRHLDLLMMVQGWRKYPWQQLADTTRQMRYEPERTMTVSGGVYKMPAIDDTDADDVAAWQEGRGMTGHHSLAEADQAADPWGIDSGSDATADGTTTVTATADDTAADGGSTAVEYSGDSDVANLLGGNGVGHEVMVEAEVILGDEIVGTRQMTRQGRFLFEIPPFYGATFLDLKAYDERDSVKKAMSSRQDATIFQETAFADYYVKRDMPYPVGSQPYSYYQNHAPEWQVTVDEDSLSELSMENDVHQLQNVNVKGRRRGRRGIDWTKPAYVQNAYDLYNDITDYGLSYGHYYRGLFPQQAARFLYGNMGRYNAFHVDARLEGQTYWRNYSDIVGGMNAALQTAAKRMDNRSAESIYAKLALGRLHFVRFYTDYEPRNPDSTMVEEQYRADATLEMVPIAADGRQVVRRDRHIYLAGFSEPARFYQPDYSQQQPQQPADYRRTLYWNPNAVSDEEGRFTATFYNNARETRIGISAAGVTPDGRLLHSK